MGRQHEPSCLSGTRVDVLKEIKTWAEDGSDKRCVFWLSGMAGTGKSTIARTVAREHLPQNQLGASFFFSRGGGDVGNARKFFTTIAVQLTRKSSALKRCIVEAVNENRDIETRTLREQWELLILGPLATAKSELPQLPLLLVIDALDECDQDQDVRLILKLLASASTHISTIQLRVLVTSRPDVAIRDGFLGNPGFWHQDLVLHNVPREIVDRDITIYFREELKDIQLDAHSIGRLIEKASGLFIWAATACCFIKKGKNFVIMAPKRLSLVVDGGTGGKNPEEELDQIYAKIISNTIDQENDEDEQEELHELFKRVIGSIIILFNPLSTVALGSLLDESALGPGQSKINVEGILSNLHSVLDVPNNNTDPIRLLHPSFRDFLLAKERCRSKQFWVDEKEGHRILVDCCIRLMAASLKPDICGMHLPGTLLTDVTSSQVNKCLHPDLHYACVYWIQHLQKRDVQLHDKDQVHRFLQVHLLHWLEALGWLGRASEGILAMLSLEDHIKVSRFCNASAKP